MIYDHFLKFVAYVYSSGAAKVEKPTPSKMHGILYSFFSEIHSYLYYKDCFHF